MSRPIGVLRTRRDQRRSWPRWVRRAIWTVDAAFLVIMVGLGGFVTGGLSRLRASLPGAEELTLYRPRLTTEIYSTELQPDGSEKHTLLARLYRENREWASLDEIPPDLIHATVAIEDRAFFRHRGIDPKGMIRAALANLRSGRIRQGASTITQQLVRSMWLSRERTWERKLKEIVLALQAERCFTKQEILEMYLNEVCYGHGAYGVKAAAELYFGKQPKDLTTEECALLAGLPRWPTGYSPYRYPERAKQRRNQVLMAMAEMGYLTPSQAAELAKKPIEVQPLREHGVANFRAPHFTQFVVRQLCDRYGVAAIYEGGLKIYTTLDIRIQQAAEEEMTRWVEDLRKRGMLRRDLRGQGALVCMAVRDGGIVAMVGGIGPFEKVQFNRAAPGPPYFGRQPGSAFKPYVWTAALESGFGPNSVVSGDPISVPIGGGKYWSPRGGHGSYTLASALQWSINRVAVRLLLTVGIERVRDYASRMMGIPKSRLRPVASLALGTSEVSPLEMATGFCCFPTGGMRPTPRYIIRITDHAGNVLLEQPPQFEPVIQRPTAISMIQMMKRVIEAGTGRRARIPYPCAGKTGTAQDARDTWFVGFTPDLVAAVWIGNDDHSPLHGGAYGGTYCAPVWGKFMRRAMEIYPLHGEFPEGAGVTGTRSAAVERRSRVVTLCVDSDQRATPYCPQTYEKEFGPDEEIPGPCRIHGRPARSTSPDEENQVPVEAPAETGRRVTICTDSGQLATPYCPHTVERHFPPGTGPSGACTLHGPPKPAGGKGEAEETAGSRAKSQEKPAQPSGGRRAGEAGEASPATEQAQPPKPPAPIQEPGQSQTNGE
ncbi:MAG: PBP1A family penicillin-binding protein [Armatimonadetes bacterium]|nr:PBP1A family penicillin-binding protein [Armatimonadota bacterium]